MILTVTITLTQTNTYSVLAFGGSSGTDIGWEKGLGTMHGMWEEGSYTIVNWLINWIRGTVWICAPYISNSNWPHVYWGITVVITTMYHWLFHLLLFVMTFYTRQLHVRWNTYIIQNTMVWIQTQFQSYNSMHLNHLPIDHCCKDFHSFLRPLAITRNQSKQWAV
jgi:hypothetical protein